MEAKDGVIVKDVDIFDRYKSLEKFSQIIKSGGYGLNGLYLARVAGKEFGINVNGDEEGRAELKQLKQDWSITEQNNYNRVFECVSMVYHEVLEKDYPEDYASMNGKPFPSGWVEKTQQLMETAETRIMADLKKKNDSEQVDKFGLSNDSDA